MNMLEAQLEQSDGRLVANLGNQRLALGEELGSARPALRAFDGQTVILGIRPEDLDDATLVEAPADRRLRGRVQLREALGSEIMVHLETDARRATTDETRELAEDVGVPKADAPEAGATIVGRFTPRSRVEAGQDVEVAVDTRSLHFFDPRTGLGIYADPPKGADT
jgi:multiple sugar transport system ATP-binding protein